MIDVHLHSSFSFDSEEKHENYLESAKKLNIPVIGFSEHFDYDAYLDGENIPLADVKAYTKNIHRLKSEFPQLEILCGIEFGYRKEALFKYRELIDSYRFDYVINSVHTLKGRGDCYHDAFFIGRPLRESYTDYFNAVLESVEADYDYQIVGHIGYVSRYRTCDGAKINYRDYSDLLDKILKRIIELDKCLEINTSSGTSGSDFLPDKDVIERYISLGGKNLSFGSDAHCAKDYLRKHDLLLNYLKGIGIKELCYYKDRKKVTYKI